MGSESIFTAPRHSCSNGLAENFVRSLKAAITANSRMTEDELKIQCMKRRATGKSPVSIFRGRNLKIPRCMDAKDVTFYCDNDSKMCLGLLMHKIGN